MDYKPEQNYLFVCQSNTKNVKKKIKKCFQLVPVYIQSVCKVIKKKLNNGKEL